MLSHQLSIVMIEMNSAPLRTKSAMNPGNADS